MKIDLRFGKPQPYDYNTIIDQFSGTKVKSVRTSSIPLVQFWKNTDSNLKTLFDNLNIQNQVAVLCFEYPTSPLEGKGKSSMTDLMILERDFKIAIEAKFTEYAKAPITLIEEWLNKDHKDNREKVLGYWTKLIQPFSLNNLDVDTINKIEYQFYHRTASACIDTENPVVVYQVFYDDKTIASLENYKNQLKGYVENINPKDNLKFFIWEIEVEQKCKDEDFEEIFSKMKSTDLYIFKESKIEEL